MLNFDIVILTLCWKTNFRAKFENDSVIIAMGIAHGQAIRLGVAMAPPSLVIFFLVFITCLIIFINLAPP